MKIEFCPNRVNVLTAILIGLLLAAGNGVAGEKTCYHCGMVKSQFGHSWIVLEDENGVRSEACSIHCAAIDMVLNKDTLLNAITVGDYNSKKQIDAYQAFWVIGGDRPGVMTERAKWAFESKDAADSFIKDHGGRAAVFEEVIRAAFVDLYEDTIAIKRKRKITEMK